MPNFTYTTGRPAGNLTPAQQRPDLQTNNDNNASIWEVDHFGFNNNDGGYHAQATFPLNNVPSLPSGLTSIVYTNQGVADTGASQLFLANKNAAYQISPIKAWACFTGNSGAILSFQKVNITSVTRNAIGVYTIVMPSGTVTGSNYAILVSGGRRTTSPSTNCMVINYSITNSTEFVLYAVDPIANTSQDPVQVSFSVIQI